MIKDLDIGLLERLERLVSAIEGRLEHVLAVRPFEGKSDVQLIWLKIDQVPDFEVPESGVSVLRAFRRGK